MAQVKWEDSQATVTFDEAELNVLAEAKKADPNFLQTAITEQLKATAKHLNQVAIQQKIAEIRAGEFGPVGRMTLA